MEKKNKTLLYVVGVLLVIGVGITLAYFAAAILASGNGAVTNVKTANIGDTTIVTEGNVEFTDTDIYPGHKNISKIKITATGQGDITYHLIWKGENTLQTSLNYTLYKSSTDETPSVTCTKKSQGNLTKILFEECTNNGFENLEQLATGSIGTTTAETIFRLKEDESITATSSGTVVYYYVVLEFPNTDSGQNFDANGKFEGETNIEVPDSLNLFVDMPTFVATIKESGGYKGEIIPAFAEAATGAETEENNGIYKVSDGMYGGESYYWRGAAITNHLIFADMCWRIVRINGDNSIRLIYNGAVQDNNTCHGNGKWDGSNVGTTNEEKFFATTTGDYDNPSYVGWTYTLGSQRPTTDAIDSNIKTQLEKWYKIHISNKGFDDDVVTGRFCNDRNIVNREDFPAPWNTLVGEEYKFGYAGFNRIWINNEPTLGCADSNDVYSLKIGTITADEAMFAGGINANNTSYYLYNGSDYWTMTPSCWNYWNGNNYAQLFSISTAGHLGDAGVDSNYIFLRPVINLRSDTRFYKSGNGTETNPYVVV